MRYRSIIVVFSVLFVMGSVFAQPAVNEILQKVEDNTKLKTDGRAIINITQQKENQGVKAFQMTWYRRDADDAFMIIFTAPESEKGNGYLRMGDNFWMYRRNTRTFQHVNRDESIGGTDAHGENFESRNLTELYGGKKDESGKEMIKEELLGQVPVYKINLVAKVNDVDYPEKIFWIRKDNNLLLKEEAYSASKTLMQTTYYLKYVEVQKKYVSTKMMFIDEFEKGNKTIVEISGISTEKLDNQIFTKAYLENLSK